MERVYSRPKVKITRDVQEINAMESHQAGLDIALARTVFVLEMYMKKLNTVNVGNVLVSLHNVKNTYM